MPASAYSMKRIYLAGPEVFLDNHAEISRRKKAICREHGLVGVFPLDAGFDFTGLSKRQAGLSISKANEDLIRSCDLLIANLTPFRGPSADAGTIYELGFMRGLGRPVYGYSNVDASFFDRTKTLLGKELRKRCDGTLEDAAGMALEDFDLVDNLMIAGAGPVFERAVSPPDVYADLEGFRKCVSAAAGGD